MKKDLVETIILAAGLGKRLGNGQPSRRPKVLHQIAGRPVIDYVVEAVLKAGQGPPIIVVGHEGDKVKAHLGPRFRYASQDRLKGTANAVIAAQSAINPEARGVVILMGDMPFILPETLKKLARAGRALRLLVATLNNPPAYGRIVRGPSGAVQKIVEVKNAHPGELKINEVNVGGYFFPLPWFWEGLGKIKPNAQTGEYYLTDIIAIARSQSQPIETIATADPCEAMGINTPEELATCEEFLVKHGLPH